MIAATFAVLCVVLLIACVVLRNSPAAETAGDAAFFALLAFAIFRLTGRGR